MNFSEEAFYVDKSTPWCGEVQTRMSQGKPRQDKRRVKVSRYVIKAMRGESKGRQGILD
jgi:hypothetical protein